MFTRYMVIRASDCIRGTWGTGETQEEADQNCLKAGGRKKEKRLVIQFTSELPFAPVDRDSTDAESDCWMNQDMTYSYLRCTPEIIESPSN